MIFRLILICVTSLIVASCAQKVTTEDDSACLQIAGDSPGSIADFGYIVVVRDGQDASDVATEYQSKYGRSFEVLSISSGSFGVNINDTSVLNKLSCDSRVSEISYDTIPSDMGR